MTEQGGGEPDRLAPVIPLFGGEATASLGAPSDQSERTAPTWRSTWQDDTPRDGSGRDEDSARDEWDEWDGPYDDDDDFVDEGAGDDCLSIELEIAERNLLRKLRTRSLSVSEARAVVAERDLGAADVDGVLERFRRNGYLDDAALAEQLVHIAVERKGQGRHVVAQTLAKRGIPRAVIDQALATLPDDDGERALDFARSKAPSMSRLEPGAALRRLVGQLSRRGYPSSVAMSAARQALDEQSRPRGPFFA